MSSKDVRNNLYYNNNSTVEPCKILNYKACE